MSEALPAFPGAVGVSHLRVYDWEAADGLRGGTPHVHSVCTEAYWVVAGTGAVQTLGPRGFEQVPLEPGAFVWFSPGTIHRLVHEGGGLEILVLMQNAGLPEAGDMVICFPTPVLADAETYARAATLGEGERTTAGDDAAARRRRDLGVEGFLALRRDCDARGGEALREFYDHAAARLAPKLSGWKRIFERGPRAAADATARHLEALARGDASHLMDARVLRHAPPPAERRMGCCGTLGVYLNES